MSDAKKITLYGESSKRFFPEAYSSISPFSAMYRLMLVFCLLYFQHEVSAIDCETDTDCQPVKLDFCIDHQCYDKKQYGKPCAKDRQCYGDNQRCRDTCGCKDNFKRLKGECMHYLSCFTDTHCGKDEFYCDFNSQSGIGKCKPSWTTGKIVAVSVGPLLLVNSIVFYYLRSLDD